MTLFLAGGQPWQWHRHLACEFRQFGQGRQKHTGKMPVPLRFRLTPEPFSPGVKNLVMRPEETLAAERRAPSWRVNKSKVPPVKPLPVQPLDPAISTVASRSKIRAKTQSNQ